MTAYLCTPVPAAAGITQLLTAVLTTGRRRRQQLFRAADRLVARKTDDRRWGSPSYVEAEASASRESPGVSGFGPALFIAGFSARVLYSSARAHHCNIRHSDRTGPVEEAGAVAPPPVAAPT